MDTATSVSTDLPSGSDAMIIERSKSGAGVYQALGTDNRVSSIEPLVRGAKRDDELNIHLAHFRYIREICAEVMGRRRFRDRETVHLVVVAPDTGIALHSRIHMTRVGGKKRGPKLRHSK